MSGPVTPRWEWRCFGASEDPFLARTPERVAESDERYLLSRESDAGVKVRDGKVDVKQRLEVAADGLERWTPVLKTAFPLSAADADLVLTTLQAAGPPPVRGAETLDELAAGRPDLMAVDVHKSRVHYVVDGCMAELTELRTEHGTTRTIAVEAEDPARVRAAVRGLGLADRPVACVARGLKALAGFGARRYAVIDVGTNSVKFHVGERAPDGTWRTVVDRAEITRLGEGLAETGRLGGPAIERTVAAIAAMAAEARTHGAATIAAVGTAGLRIAPNARDVVAAVLDRCGVRIEIIPGDDEARLAYRAVRAALAFDGGTLVVFDTGGGSSQFTFGDGEHVHERFSVDVGAARFTERFGLDGPVGEATVEAACAAVAAELQRLADRAAPDLVVGMGGAVTNLAAVKHALVPYDPDVVRGTVLERDEIDRQIARYRALGADERRAIPGLQPARAEVILAGACIVRTILALLGSASLTVSDRGLRHGVLVERFGNAHATAAAARQ
jgi:exopolyphosphatase/guanosine-5'-triphosphate,3'-diphosphate pyrophosphatase